MNFQLKEKKALLKVYHKTTFRTLRLLTLVGQELEILGTAGGRHANSQTVAFQVVKGGGKSGQMFKNSAFQVGVGEIEDGLPVFHDPAGLLRKEWFNQRQTVLSGHQVGSFEKIRTRRLALLIVDAFVRRDSYRQALVVITKVC